MTPSPKIIILGTSHPLQCGTDKFSSDQISEFKQLVHDICENEKVGNIVEEMNDEGLANHGVENTIAYYIASEINIKHSYVDLCSELKSTLGVSDDQIVSIALRKTDNGKLNSMRALLTEKLLHPIRERYWLSHILRENTWPTLFICGSDHGQAMQDLVNSVGYGPILSWFGHCPEELKK